MTNEDKYWSKILALLGGYCKIVKDGLDERWDKFTIEIYDAETSEVIGGLLARQATLTKQLANAPQIWNPHIAPLVLRCMVDVHITLAWILQDPKDRAKKYILYGLGQEKLHVEYLKAEMNDFEENEKELEQIIQFKESWLNSQRADFLIEVNVGGWAEVSTREMAKQSGCESLYNFVYVPYSGVAHNMWQHVGVFNLKQCGNALHKYHKVPNMPEFFPELDYVYRSAKYISRSFEIFDQTFNIENKTLMPLDYFTERHNVLFGDENENEDA